MDARRCALEWSARRRSGVFVSSICVKISHSVFITVTPLTLQQLCTFSLRMLYFIHHTYPICFKRSHFLLIPRKTSLSGKHVVLHKWCVNCLLKVWNFSCLLQHIPWTNQCNFVDAGSLWQHASFTQVLSILSQQCLRYCAWHTTIRMEGDRSTIPSTISTWVTKKKVEKAQLHTTACCWNMV